MPGLRDMPKERNRAPFASFGADMKEARQALGYTQKALAEAFKVWIKKITAKGENTAKYLCEAVAKVKHRVGNLLFIIRRPAKKSQA